MNNSEYFEILHESAKHGNLINTSSKWMSKLHANQCHADDCHSGQFHPASSASLTLRTAAKSAKNQMERRQEGLVLVVLHQRHARHSVSVLRIFCARIMSPC